MSTQSFEAQVPFSAPSERPLSENDSMCVELQLLLAREFGTEFALFSGETGELSWAPKDIPIEDWSLAGELSREIVRRGASDFIQEDEPFIVLAIPFYDEWDQPMVAVHPFVTRPVSSGEDLSTQSRILGLNLEKAAVWACKQKPIPAERLQQTSRLIAEKLKMCRRVRELESENADVSLHLASTYEEISLLYRLTQNLKLSRSDEELGRIALQWLQETLPADGLAIQLLPPPQSAKANHAVREKPIFLTQGRCPVDGEAFTRLTEQLQPAKFSRPVVLNRRITQESNWKFPEIREMIVTAMQEGDNVFGYLAAFNHHTGAEFGTVEGSLISSISAILGIHCGNIELYRQQAELLTGVVRALTSAIDAKDRYTHGHSDRVARIAVRLAEELGCDEATKNNIYLSGLLHDIGKIGIDDHILRKPGKLSEQEYAHIKHHVSIGHRILRDLGKLESVLPVILHHHESWDGEGYPHQLSRLSIPFEARIVAVADAFDAMSSDRPYRQGMADDKIDQIMHGGSDKQWDPDVVNAFFRARDDIRRIIIEEKSEFVPEAVIAPPT